MMSEENHDLESPEIAESIAASDAEMALSRRGVRWARAHWKSIALAAFGLPLAALAWRSKRLRPLMKTAVAAYAAPFAKRALARVRV